MFKKLGILILALILLFFLFNFLLMPWYVKHANLVKVPDVTGLNFLEAKNALENAGLEAKQGDIKYDESKPVGMVLEQNPYKGETVKNGRRVYLTVCGGEQLVEVPRLIGKSLRDAKFSLEQRNLQLGETVKKFTNEYPEDIVVSQITQPGSKIKKQSRVDLIISNGPQIGDISIPDFVGKKMADAKKLIEEKKLKVGKITYQSSDLPAGQVVDQYPKKDKSAKENTPIDLFISKRRTEPEKTQDASTVDDSEVKKEIKKEEKKNDNIKPKSDDPDKTKDKKKENTETVKPKESTEKPKDKKDVPKPPKEKQQ